MSIIRPAILALEDSPIAEIWRIAQGVPGLIDMIAGEPDAPTPRFICDAATKALEAGHTFYADCRGIPPLRAALRRYLHRLYGVETADERLTVTSSGMGAVQLIAQAVLSPGDKAVAITPCWPNVVRAMQISGAQVIEFPLGRGGNGWSLDLTELEAALTPDVRVLYVASPANPTGWTIQPHEAKALLAMTRARGIALIADEVYHRIVYDRPVSYSFLECAEPDDALFVVNSFSKSWAMPGWRLGWLIAPAGLSRTLEKLVQFNTSGAPAFLQYGAIAALELGEPFITEFVGRCRNGRAIVSRRLAGMRQVREVANEGAFYAMFAVEGVTDMPALCKRLAEEAKIGVAPGSAFGRGAEGLLRLCYAKDGALLEAAMDRLEAVVGRM